MSAPFIPPARHHHHEPSESFKRKKRESEQTRTDAESDPSSGLDVHLEGDLLLGGIYCPPEITDFVFQRRGIGVVRERLERTGEGNSVVNDECQYEDEGLQSHGSYRKKRSCLISMLIQRAYSTALNMFWFCWKIFALLEVVID